MLLGCHQSLGEEVVLVAQRRRSAVAGTGDLKFGLFSLCKTLPLLKRFESDICLLVGLRSKIHTVHSVAHSVGAP
jgi:hypothetical protein